MVIRTFIFNYVGKYKYIFDKMKVDLPPASITDYRKKDYRLFSSKRSNLTN